MSAPLIIGKDAIVRKVAKLTERLAHTGHPIFIEGEHGVGREHLARFLHARGPRVASPISILDLGDAARGAVDLRAACDDAAGGTLVIRKCEMLDADSALPVLAEAAPRTRLVMIATGALCQRQSIEVVDNLGALSLYLPPLRMRRTDIADLTLHFLEQSNADNAGADASIADDALLSLWRYDWPGNVGELRDEVRAALERAPGGYIRSVHLSHRIHPQPPPIDRSTSSGRKTRIPLRAELRRALLA